MKNLKNLLKITSAALVSMFVFMGGAEAQRIRINPVYPDGKPAICKGQFEWDTEKRKMFYGGKEIKGVLADEMLCEFYGEGLKKGYVVIPGSGNKKCEISKVGGNKIVRAPGSVPLYSIPECVSNSVIAHMILTQIPYIRAAIMPSLKA